MSVYTSNERLFDDHFEKLLESLKKRFDFVVSRKPALFTTNIKNLYDICYHPTMWRGDFPRYGKKVIFILDGAKDRRYQEVGSALFPDILKRKYRKIRKTILAYSMKMTLEGYDDASACGIQLTKGADWDITLRVVTDLGAQVYKLNRWE